MIAQRSRGFYDLFVVLQLGMAVILYWLHFAVVQYLHSRVASDDKYVIYCFLLVGGLLFEAIHRHQESDCLRPGFRHRHRKAFRQTLFASIAVIFFLVATKDQVISRLFFFSYFVLLYLALLGSSYALPKTVARLTFDASRRDRTLLVGSSKRICANVAWLAEKSQLGVEIVGALCDEKLSEIGGLPVLGRVDRLMDVVREQRISQVVVVELPSFSIFLSKLANECESLGVRLLVMSDLEEKFRHRIVYLENDGRHFFALRQEPLENPFNRAIKRAIDLAVALPAVLLVLPPVAVCVWLFHRWQSPGPLFYIQDRHGFQNRPFQIIKFRTMHPINPDPGRQATMGDQRVFPAGRWLRHLSLDELPQFLNVLRGEMSVVGPRPFLQAHNESFSRLLSNYQVRALVKPGISGLAQVQGLRGEATDEGTLRQRIESDIHYLENWSLGGDLWIIVRTAWQMIFPPKTAY